MTYTHLLTELNNGIFTITINRPDKLNALNEQVFLELNNALDEVYNNAAIKTVIITGAGEKAFVAGADIQKLAQLNKEQAMAFAQYGQDVFFKIENSKKPIVAAVNGFALGGGCELAMACHFRIASDKAKFGLPEVNLGLIPGFGGTQRLTQLIGKGKSMELLMTTQTVDAAQALQWGLVNYVTTPENLLQKTTEILLTLQSKAPIAISKIIECVNNAVVSNSAFTNGKTGYEKEVQAFGECFSTQDMQEGTAAFLQKRKAHFLGK